MTDPFTDLERELLGAHARDRGRRRHLPAARRAMAATASLAAIAGAFLWLGGLADVGDPERASSPLPGQTEAGWTAYAPRTEDGDPVPGACDRPPEPELTQDAVPPSLTEMLRVLRRPKGEGDDEPLPAVMFSSQALRIYDQGRRRLAADGRDAYAWAADVVARAQVVDRQRTCDRPEGDVVPGVCLGLLDRGGSLSACFTREEIESGRAFIDRGREVAGLAPDGARLARSGGASAEVRENFFVLPVEAGPDTEVAFVE